MAEKDATLAKHQDGGVVQACHATALQKRIAYQEITVAHHEKEGAVLAGLFQNGRSLCFKAVGFVQRIVTHPDLKQITEHEHRIGLRGAQVLAPSI